MRKVLVIAAAAVVLLANGWSIWQAARNRAGACEGTLELTERELPLQAIGFDSSVTLLRINWRTDGGGARPPRTPAWLDTNKLAELGFDCSLPPNSPEARRHYGSMPPRRVFLALEYQADRSGQEKTRSRDSTGLVIVDAARDPRQLRQRYADTGKHIICRGLVGLALRKYDRDGARLSTPVLEAWIFTLCSPELSVPKPINRLLLGLSRNGPEEENKPVAEPRFSARVRWGSNYEPWVDDIRLLRN